MNKDKILKMYKESIDKKKNIVEDVEENIESVEEIFSSYDDYIESIEESLFVYGVLRNSKNSKTIIGTEKDDNDKFSKFTILVLDGEDMIEYLDRMDDEFFEDIDHTKDDIINSIVKSDKNLSYIIASILAFNETSELSELVEREKDYSLSYDDLVKDVKNESMTSDFEYETEKDGTFTGRLKESKKTKILPLPETVDYTNIEEELIFMENYKIVYKDNNGIVRKYKKETDSLHKANIIAEQLSDRISKRELGDGARIYIYPPYKNGKLFKTLRESDNRISLKEEIEHDESLKEDDINTKFIQIISLPDYKIEENGIDTKNMMDVLEYLKRYDYGNYDGEIYDKNDVMEFTKNYIHDDEYFLSTDGMQYTLYFISNVDDDGKIIREFDEADDDTEDDDVAEDDEYSRENMIDYVSDKINVLRGMAENSPNKSEINFWIDMFSLDIDYYYFDIDSGSIGYIEKYEDYRKLDANHVDMGYISSDWFFNSSILSSIDNKDISDEEIKDYYNDYVYAMKDAIRVLDDLDYKDVSL